MSFLDILSSHNNGIFEATFEVPTLLQVYFIIHCLWTGLMGILCTYDPSWSPITENGVFKRGKDTFTDPNVRGAWNVRGGSMFIVTAGALFFGIRECYLLAMAAAVWREGYNCVELLKFKKGGDKIVFNFWKSPFGYQPPLALFFLCNVFALWCVVKAA